MASSAKIFKALFRVRNPDVSFIGYLQSPSKLLLPNALGPNSARPEATPHTLFFNNYVFIKTVKKMLKI